jgi:hypothetical protein
MEIILLVLMDSTTKLMHKGQKSGNRALKIPTRLTLSPTRHTESLQEITHTGTQKEQVDITTSSFHIYLMKNSETPETAEVHYSALPI